MNNKDKYDKKLFIAVAFLTLFGYVMVISAHANVWVKFGPQVFAFEIFKVTLYIIFGIFIMTIVRKKFDIKIVFKYIKIIFFIVIIMMGATLAFEPQYGAQAWIRFPGGSIQPVELLKLTIILYYAYHFGKFYKKDVSALRIMLTPTIILLISFLFIVLGQNDLGGAMTLLIIALCIFMAVPEKKFNKIKFSILFIMVITIFVFYYKGSEISNLIFSLPSDAMFKTQLVRIATLFDPLRDVYGSGYQLSNSLAAISESGLIPKGLGQSDIKYIVPEPYNDAIIAVIAEELGLLGISAIFLTYLYIISRLFSYAKIAHMHVYDRLILIGIASFFMAQFFVNIGGMVGLIPMTGVTLLFVSSGGTSIVTAFLSIGVAQGVIKRYL